MVSGRWAVLLLFAMVVADDPAGHSGDDGFVGAPTTCDQVDDDSVYNMSTCYSYDVDACKNNCASGSTCDYFCGSGEESCSDGGMPPCMHTQTDSLIKSQLFFH